ncbi:MAG: hypothetical protein AUJ92_12200 [Armatimonadetes bacterium CG2_30_59_28]|nr:PKD domain-containing protein [Armatimonadota bacterium]OIO93557.1 MAG: hypothetical protein AUJ92_12200 [Armatimonadetes bacterium CG2_30_59_28]PIX41181.1 MAG: hypothetical protein COZ56_12750 [Armatimonadetes bacterium CG_4_8_14_3_um_filter_58_9]PIY43070.1 MAG: hypothetical protein COZ05_12160 [Armatimonadetes bacterium CG_4_10_14_3_um_filter_59_10]PJB68760.1 MAG: hypothetical protein CO095_10870 [Armatimonadetes bacterium CG_4_9_14_3_um_filter_58_7]
MIDAKAFCLIMLLALTATQSHAQFTPAQPAVSAIAAPEKPATGELILYDGSLARSRFVAQAGSWGGGAASEVTEIKFKGPGSLKVDIRGPYEGGRVDFQKGPGLPKSDEGAYLVLYTMLTDQQQTTATGIPGADIPTKAMPLGGMAPPGAMESTEPGGTPGGAFQPGEKKEELEHLRLAIFFDQGMGLVERYPIIVYDETPEGWSTVAIPFAAFTHAPVIDGKLRRIAICGDARQTIHIGRISIVRDTTPMQGEIRRPSTRDERHDTEIKLGQDVDLKLFPEVGMAAIETTWDFDDKDGIGVDAEGLEVVYRYKKRGTYTVTATVADIANQKQTISVQYTVTVK